MRARNAAMLGTVLLLASCNGKVLRVNMDSARLAPTPASARNTARLTCPHRLKDVVDARSGDGEAGGLGWHAFKFSNAAQTIRDQLLGAGLKEDTSGVGTTPAVDIRVVQLYLTQNQSTKIPVAVYRVSIDDAPEFVIRSQKASMNWNGTEDEAYAAYARVLADVNRQLIEALNARCGRS